MNEDIETLREFIRILTGREDHLGDRAKDALAALERVEKELVNLRNWLGAEKEIHNEYTTERDSLRAKLEKAKDTLEFYAERMNYTARRGMKCGITKDNFGDCARAILSELSADAPAQPTQISDEAIRRAVKKFHHYAGVDDFAAMRAAIAAALNPNQKLPSQSN